MEDILDKKLYLFKMLYEYILFFLILIYLLYIAQFREIHKNILYLSALSIFFLLYGIINNHDLTLSIKDFRLFFLPILFSLMLHYSLFMKNTDLKQLLNFYILLSTLILFVGLYQYFTFNGDIESIWRYAYLLQANKEMNPNYQEHFINYQLIRNGDIRVSSIFISALDFSYYLSFFSFLIYILFLQNKKTIYLLLFLIINFGIYTAQVRTGFILLFISIFIYHLLKLNKNYYNRIAYAMPFIFIVITFLYMLIGGGLNDSSTLGRLVQYDTLINNFTLLGSGLGKYTFTFDSLYIYLFLTYGIFSILLILFQLKLIKTLLYIYTNRLLYSNNRYEIIFIEFMSVYNLSVLYLFAFQHTLGSPTFFLLYLFSFVVISKIHNNIKALNHDN